MMTACLPMCSCNESHYRLARGVLLAVRSVDITVGLENPLERFLQFFGGGFPLGGTEIQVNDWIGRPFVFKRHDLQSCEQFLAPFEEGVKCGRE